MYISIESSSTCHHSFIIKLTCTNKTSYLKRHRRPEQKMEILPQDNITASQLECSLNGNRLRALKIINANGAYANVLTEKTLKMERSDDEYPIRRSITFVMFFTS